MTDDDAAATVVPTPFLTATEIEDLCEQFAALLETMPLTPHPTERTTS